MSETSILSGADEPRPTRQRLWAEFGTLFIGVPILMAVFFGLYPLFPVILALAAISVVLLWRTPGFSFRELWRGPVLGEWRLIVGFAVALGVGALAAAAVLVPDSLFVIPRERPALWLMIMVFYPLLSAVPQEIIFRPLFFRRYGALFPNEGIAVFANALVFGVGHLFYMNPVTILMTVFAGAIFGWSYLRHRSFLLTCVLHAIAGQIVFTVGLGRYFYHGAVGG